MDIKILNEKENTVLDRTEIEFQIDSKITPSRKELAQQIAKQKGASVNLVVIRSIDQEYGLNTCNGKLVIYKNEKDLKATEKKHLFKRGIKEKKDDESNEASTAPAEEKKEEPKAEEKGE